MGKKILVIGSANVDFILRIPRFHRAGETITGENLTTAFGGKGANQAIAAKRLGSEVTFLSTMGEDAHGKAYRKYLVRSGFKGQFLLTDPKSPTGIALIEIIPEGENRIIVSPGANQTLSSRHLKKAAKAWEGARVFVAQLETPLETVQAGLEMAQRKEALTILNPAPARALSIANLVAGRFSGSERDGGAGNHGEKNQGRRRSGEGRCEAARARSEKCGHHAGGKRGLFQKPI